MDNPPASRGRAVPPPPPPWDQPPIYSPDGPPPSYDDATHSASAPLLVGPPPNYGTYRAYSDPDESSTASTEVEASESSLPQWIGQFLVVTVFVAIIYSFWSLIHDPPDSLTHLPGQGRHPG